MCLRHERALHVGWLDVENYCRLEPVSDETERQTILKLLAEECQN